MDSNSIISLIIQAINAISNKFFSSIDNNIYPILDELIFIEPDILDSTFIKKILGSKSTEGLLILANALLIGFILYYTVRLLFSYYTGSETESPLRFIVRVIILSIIMNSSFFICEQIIIFTNYITEFIKELGYSLFNTDISFSSLINLLNSNLTLNSSDIDMFSIDGVIKMIISFGIFNLLFSYALRYIMIKIIVLLCPFAILCLINKPTEWFFKNWLKSLFSLLFLQIIVSLIILLPHAIKQSSFKSSSEIFSKMALVGTIYALFKANDFLKEFIGGISTNVSSGISTIKKFFTKM